MQGIIKCTIRTPQHKDEKIHHWHTQSGELDIKTFLFTPVPKKEGDHKVQFSSIKDFEKYQVK